MTVMMRDTEGATVTEKGCLFGALHLCRGANVKVDGAVVESCRWKT